MIPRQSPVSVKTTGLLLSAQEMNVAESSLKLVYAQLPAEAKTAHLGHQQRFSDALKTLSQGEQAKAWRAQGKEYRDFVAAQLPSLLQQIEFDPSIYKAKNTSINGYGRYLLHSDAAVGDHFCLQIFAFDPAQKTPIHNHPNECASFIAKGQLSERLYEEPVKGHKEVAKAVKNPRETGSWAGFNPQELNIPHSLKNKTSEMAVSIHLYRDMDGLTSGQQVAAKDMFQRAAKHHAALAAV